MNKFSKKIKKGATRLLNIIPNPDLEKLVDQILEVTQKEFYTYPDAPKVNWSSTIPWIPQQTPISGYNPDGEVYDSIPDKNKALKQVSKAKRNFVKGFGALKKKNEELYNMLQLHVPLDLVTQYASDLESQLLASRGN